MSCPALTSAVASLPEHGLFSVWAGPLDGPASFEHNAAAQHYAASTMKLALVIAAYRQAERDRLDLDSTVVVHSDFDSVVAGARFEMDRSDDSDEQPWRRLGTPVALRWLANHAIVRSSNLATNLLLEQVGLDPVAETLAEIGTAGSIVARGIEDAPAREAGHHNLVTAADLARTLQALTAERIASPQSCREILDTLAAQQINDAIPQGLPVGTKVAHKSGWVTGVSHDAGIVYRGDCAPYVLVVCTTSTVSEDESLRLIADIAAASWADREQFA